MNNLEIFANNDFGEIRAVEIDGEGWLVGKDVAEVLGYKNPRKALLDHVDEEDKGVTKCDTPGGSQEMTVINESGLYSLVLRSKLPGAKKFKRWVTSEVLPSIRKHGMYAKNELLDNPDLLIQVATELKKEREAKRLLEEENKKLLPKAEFYDTVTESKDAIPMSSVAKVLNIKGIGRNKLFEILRSKNILRGNNEPYQTMIDREYFRVIETKYTKNGDTHINLKTLVTQKGLDYIRKIIK